MGNKAYTILMEAGDQKAEVNLYGEVVESIPTDWWTGEPIDGLFISLDQFISDLEKLKNMKQITFRINSVGGDAHAGITIYNRIRELDAETTTIVDGLAASAASIIAQAGDKRIVNIGTQVMIHGASTLMYGYFNEAALRKQARALNTINKSVAGIYAERSGREVDEILAMMKSEKWMTPDEAVEEGFADEVGGRDAPKAEATEGVKDKIIVNGITHRLHNMPMPQMQMAVIHQMQTPESVHIDEEPETQKNSKGVKEMDLKELKEKHAELCEEFRNEITSEIKAEMAEKNQMEINEAVAKAVQEDHERMKAIDSIANQVGDPAMVQKAKYDEPMTAEQLALKAMQMQAEAGNSFMEARKNEVAQSRASEIKPEPVSGSEEDTRAKDIADGAALIAGKDWKGGN